MKYMIVYCLGATSLPDKDGWNKAAYDRLDNKIKEIENIRETTAVKSFHSDRHDVVGFAVESTYDAKKLLELLAEPDKFGAFRKNEHFRENYTPRKFENIIILEATKNCAAKNSQYTNLGLFSL